MFDPPTDSHQSGRNLIICCDGTNNQFGLENTNVVRLVQALDRSPARQRVYYDPGVGTLPEPGAWGKMQKTASVVAGLAFGGGINRNVKEAYTYILNMWQPGDRLFLFGFSRGAYTARILAGMLHKIGLLPRGAENLVPYAFRLYKKVRDERKKGSGKKEWDEICEGFRWTFSRPMHELDEKRHCPVHFLGVWDTVSSVGVIWSPEQFPFTARNPSIRTIRHAVSIDERRWFFRQNLMKKWSEDQDLVEVWFPGVHCDVGGGYSRLFSKDPDRFSDLWRLSFDWISTEAEKAGLILDGNRLHKILEGVAQDPSADPQHESLEKWWKLAEYCYKPVWNSQLRKREWKRGHGEPRTIPENAFIGGAALKRIRASDIQYAPRNLSEDFKQQVIALTELPEAIAYTPDEARRDS